MASLIEEGDGELRVGLGTWQEEVRKQAKGLVQTMEGAGCAAGMFPPHLTACEGKPLKLLGRKILGVA